MLHSPVGYRKGESALPLDEERTHHVETIARKLQIRPNQIRAAIALIDEGNTIPFIARYRKEMTGELDENQLRSIADAYEFEKNLRARKADVLRLLEEQGVFQDEVMANQLTQAVEQAETLAQIDDVYRPYRPKRKTRASVAKERQLEPLAMFLDGAPIGTNESDVLRKAQEFVSADREVFTADEALAGAFDILAEEMADDASYRGYVRKVTMDKGRLRSVAVDATVESVYEQYYDYEEPIAKIPPHRVLAMDRGERDEVLRVSVLAPVDEIVRHLRLRRVPSETALSTYLGQFFSNVAQDAYKRLIAPSIEREVRKSLTEAAHLHAIEIFGENLRQLLLQPPMRGRAVLGVDPAYRTGCKLAAVDDTGKLLEVAVIYPTPPQSKVEEAEKVVIHMLDTYRLDVIAIGNGTASRETESFIADCIRKYRDHASRDVAYVMVSEAGASVYSASPLAGEEFPKLDVSERSAISIARRLQDPLAELVKIDPKSVGVGQYQHDVAQNLLGQKLGAVVESAVNQVGVDVNTASPSLLSYVSGLNKTAAKNIVQFRESNGRFPNRKTLKNVPRIGPKTLEQCVGFLRILDGDDMLDATPIHPESYDVVERLLRETGQSRAVFRDKHEREVWLQTVKSQSEKELAERVEVGVPTLRDILSALERPGRDPREDVPAPILRTDVVKLEDLSVGMELTGTVRNVVDFGAFVDVGVKNDGLVHISQLKNGFVKHPLDVVSVGDVVQVRVVQVDVARGRLGLSMKDVSNGRGSTL